jgi:hypothetical protein
MKKEKQIGLRVSLPALFLMELEEYHKRSSGAHRAMKLSNFAGYLLGLGLEQYRKGNAAPPEGEQKEAPDIGNDPPEEPNEENVYLFNVSRAELKNMFRDFEEVMGPPPPVRSLRLVRAGRNIEEAR